MADLVQLLPDSIANKIAAGEVVQRPSSVIKELVENAIDAGSTQIRILLKDAGKGLIQVIDNGCGMSETDARKSFERHATSKLRYAEDLFAIRTMGFRGEALASIAAVAQVEMKTRLQSRDLGVRIQIEGGQLTNQEACQCPSGTNIAVKNLFYNIPARRNFLKSNSSELKHIMDEIYRLAIANPDVAIQVHHNNQETLHLSSGNLRQRIVALMGQNTNKKLVPLTADSVDTDIVSISGFISKPEFAKKTRGEQYFFVNNRFIKSSYLNHAVMSAYDGLLADGAFPLYVIMVDIDPAAVDVNVHPTKQEVKFEDDRLIYNYLKVAVRHALGSHNVTPTLDFEQESGFNNAGRQTLAPQQSNKERFESAFNDTPSSAPTPGPAPQSNKPATDWSKLYEVVESGAQNEPEPESDAIPEDQLNVEAVTISSKWSEHDDQSTQAQPLDAEKKEPYQIHNTYVVTQIKSGFLLIDQQAASERILYEKYFFSLGGEPAGTQKLLFPKTLEFLPADSLILEELLSELNTLGFDMQTFGQNTFILHGIPADMEEENEIELIESMLEEYKLSESHGFDSVDRFARALAKSSAIRRGKRLDIKEMQAIIDQLFACEFPYKSPSGRNCLITYKLEELARRFSN